MKIELIERNDDFIEYRRGMRFAKDLADMYQRLVYTEEELLIPLSNSLRVHQVEIEDEDTLTGRIAAFFGEAMDREMITIDGMRLKQLFELLQEEPPVNIRISQMYRVDVKSLRDMLARTSPECSDQPGLPKMDRVPKDLWYLK